MTANLGGIIRRLRRAVSPYGELSDAQLLERWVGTRDEAAFEVLVWRHGGMVLGTCRRVLRSEHDTEDAFQATFLILARKASSIRKGELVASWLHKVACRIALEARGRSARYPALLPMPEEVPAVGAPDPEWSDARPVLDEEINRLPDKYRVPFVLCYLEGKTTNEAAECLGCPRGTVATRLAWARDRLRKRLTRRGLTLSSLAVGVPLLVSRAQASPPAPLMVTTIRAAVQYAIDQTLAATAGGAALTQAVVQGMWMAKVRAVAAWAVSLIVLAAGAGVAAHHARAHKLTAPSGETNSGRHIERAQEVSGVVAWVAADGKRLTLTLRGNEEDALTVRIGDASVLRYQGVGPGEARPTVGYDAHVRLAGGSRDVATRIDFRGKEGVWKKPPSINAAVVAVSADAGTITLALPQRAKRAPPRTATIRLTEKTGVTYSQVEDGGASPTPGYRAQVWLVEGEDGVASRIHFLGEAAATRKVRKPADAAGRILALSEDGSTLTLFVPPARKDGAAKTLTLRRTGASRIEYHDVGSGGAKPTVGYEGRVWLAEGRADTVDQATFRAVGEDARGTIAGKVMAVAADGKTFVVELPPEGKDAAAKRLTVHLTARTQLVYDGVGPGGGRPTVGYTVRVWPERGAQHSAKIAAFAVPE